MKPAQPRSERATAGEHIGVPAAQAIIQAHKPEPLVYVAIWQLEQGVRDWLAGKTRDLAQQIKILTHIKNRTTSGLIALDDLLAAPDLPGPRRKGDLVQAAHNVLEQLRRKSEAAGQEAMTEEQKALEAEVSLRPPDMPSDLAAPTPCPDRPQVEPARVGLHQDDAMPAPGLSGSAVAGDFPRRVGAITIVHGDSRRLTAYVAPDSAHLAITSPPYNVGTDYDTHDDRLSTDNYQALLREVFGECHRALVDGGRIAVIVPLGVGRKPWTPLAAPVGALLTELGFTLRGIIIWDKSTCGNRTSWGSYRLPSDPALRDRTEAIVVAHKGNGYLPLPAEVVQHDAKGSYSAFLPGELFLALTQDLWQVAPESAQRIGHPAPFPLELAERLIRLYGYPSCHVVDPFGGSGTVGVAAQKLGCRATLVDIDAGYCALAARRCTPDTESMP